MHPRVHKLAAPVAWTCSYPVFIRQISVLNDWNASMMYIMTNSFNIFLDFNSHSPEWSSDDLARGVPVLKPSTTNLVLSTVQANYLKSMGSSGYNKFKISL